MGKRRLFLFFLITVWLPIGMQAQISNLRSRVIPAGVPVQALDTLSVLPPLMWVNDSASGAAVPLRFFTLEHRFLRTDTAALRAWCPVCTQLRVAYRVLPADLGKPVFRLDSTNAKRAGRNDDIAFDYSPYAPAGGQPFGAPGISSTGAYTRGLALGNSQNLTFNSNLNLQMEGKLGNDLNVRAALSDNSVPLQPDGSTQRLQEFDRVYIELERRNVLLAAGDQDFTRPGGYFSNYFKRVQGAKVALAPTAALPGGWAGVGISRGKFNRQIVQGQEGNQGPYRMQGAEGERFIIVLAGTEKVFIDGQLMQRGLTNDYVIDYNLGEITFTQKRLITKDIRIIVEFEYAVQNYLRSTLAGHSEWTKGKGKYWFNFYSEQDGLNATGNLDLSPAQRSRLAQVGDTLQNAFASGIDTLELFDPSKVLYRAVDTVFCNGQTATILVYSTNSEQARYTARFSEVPQGQGNYIQAPNSANGRVYQWVAPDPATCAPKGNFEPVVRLIAPEQRQLHTLGAEYRISPKTFFSAELAMSRRDLNRFSPLNDGDNTGVGVYLKARRQLWSKNNWNSALDAETEWISREFLPLNPYRPPEFVRDWNLDFSNADKAAESILKAGWQLERRHWGVFRYELNRFEKIDIYQGLRQLGRLKLARQGWELLAEVNRVSSEGLLEKTVFDRPKFDISRTFSRQNKPWLKTGFYGEREKNARRDARTDTLTQQGFWYDMGRFYLQMPEARKKIQSGAYWSQRTDFLPLANGFIPLTLARDANVNGKWEHGTAGAQKVGGGLEWNFTYRNLRVTAPERTTLEPQKTYLGRLDYRFNALKSGLNYTIGYEIGSGQTPKVEFNYLLVNPGEGQYAWFDRNRDSILQLDEMELAVFQDQAAYVRVAVTTPQYIRTNNAVFNQNLRIEPRLWIGPNAKGWRRIAAKWAAQSTWQINRRVLANAPVSPWNAFELSVPDTALVGVNTTARHVFFFNRADPRWDASLSYGSNQSRLLVTTGFESRALTDYTLHGRFNLHRQWSLEADLIQSLRSNTTENFKTRNYQIPGWEISPRIGWLPTPRFRISAKYSWKSRKNTLEGQESALQNDLNAEITWNPATPARTGKSFKPATSIRAKGTWAEIRYTGASNTPVAFAMLEGLQDGRNLLWSLTVDRQLSKSMQLNLSYEGRRTGGAQRVVHVGRMQVRAVF